MDEAWRYNENNPNDWNNLLFKIYATAGDQDKQIKQAQKLLFWGNENYWMFLKSYYQDLDILHEKYTDLLDQLKDSKKSTCYRNILITENETLRLLEDLIENPLEIFYYGKFLVKDYSEQLYALCHKVILDNCARAGNRRDYKKVTKQILQLIKWNGHTTAKNIVNELKNAYPRKTALMDELKTVEIKLVIHNIET